MGIKRFAAAVCAFVTVLFAPAAAQDAGPGKAVGAVRWAAQRLLAERAATWGVDPSSVVVTNVATDGTYGVAQWSAGSRRGVEGFRYIWDRWWDVLRTDISDTGLPELACAAPLRCDQRPIAPNPAFLLDAGFPQPVVDRAAEFSLLTTQAPRAAAPDHAMPSVQRAFTRDGSFFPALDGDGYVATLQVAANNAAGAIPFTFAIRRPTQAESWVSFPGGNSWAYFTMAVENDAPLAMHAGTTLDIWCPFVLDDNMKYSLTISYASDALGPLDASIHNNTMHFVLPAFTMPPHAHMIGVVDGNP